jgi:hypothetical protein
MAKSQALSKTKESLFTLLSLFVLIKQALQSISGNEEILNSEYDDEHDEFYHLVTDTIHEALIYQIMIKTCAFLDEWNDVFGVLTNLNDRERILVVKRIAKPAYKQLMQWKQLREFRNEKIAHNHRDKAGTNIFLSNKYYHAPDTDQEIYLMCYCLKKMMDVVDYFFKPELDDLVLNLPQPKKYRSSKNKPLTTAAIKKIIKQLNMAIDDTLGSIAIRKAFMNAFASANASKE